MLDGSPAHIDEANGNVENNNPISVISSSDGLNAANKAKQALLKKGGRKLRTAAPALHHQKPPRNSPSIRLSDHNNNNTLTASSVKKPAALPGTELPAGTLTVQSPHHVKQGAKKELLKSKGGRLERGAAQPGGQSARSLPRHDQLTQTVNARSHTAKQSHAAAASHSTKRKDNRSPSKAAAVPQSSPREQKKPLHASNNVKITNAGPENLKDGEKVYAGPKFSEPPSPSVLPKPPSHWVGENEPLRSDQSREQMTVHLKSLLKVQGTS
ncbi:proline-rich nuclear receptor coactivator 1-like [Parambassis ranga]|uniref:Proline-rich nuclear receptor coactivator 1-like n=1 Tax=Parambassis ranga TaxID=210632 RepID=A0A6P7HSQ3_9TELE|nr:proline-rich nuclear receptor coactivator 1-like [Parambassis ranga]